MTTAKRRASSSAATSGCTDVQQQQQQQLQHNHNHHQHHHHHHHQLQHSHQVQQHYQDHHHNQRNNQQQQHHQHHHQQQHQQQQQHHLTLRDCSVKLPLDILWLPKSAMRPVGPDTSHTDCILVVGVSRPKLAVVFLTVMLISLFLTFHVLYDSAVYNLQAAQAVSERHRLALISGSRGTGAGGSGTGGDMNFNSIDSMSDSNSRSSSSSSSGISSRGTYIGSSKSGSGAGGGEFSNHLKDYFKPVASANQISHPMVFPSNRVHFPKTSRRLPQALIIGIRKCGTRALLEMLYLHPRIQKAGGEVHFFDRDENYMKGLEWYRKKMPHSFRGQITIEKSPSYFVSPEVPERVRAMNASIKLLLIVREPVTRAISDYTQLRSHAATAILPLAAEAIPPPLVAAPLAPAASASANGRFIGGSDTEGSGGDGGGGGGGSGGLQQKSHSLLYNKLNGKGAIPSMGQIYDNSIDDGGGGARHSSSSSSNARNGNVNRQIYAGDGNEAAYVPYTTTPSTGTAASAAALAAQIATKSFEELALFPNGTVNETYRPLTISMYHLHLHRWLEVFPREQLLVVNGDRLIEDPVSQLKRIETFLGIEHRVTSSHFYFNETKGFYCLRYDSGDRCLRETKGRKHPYVDPVVISKLRKFFAEHNQRFYELVGEDLGWPEE